MDNERYREFYKEYEGRDRISSVKLKDEFNTTLFFVTPKYVVKSRCLKGVSNKGSTYCVILTKAPLSS